MDGNQNLKSDIGEEIVKNLAQKKTIPPYILERAIKLIGDKCILAISTSDDLNSSNVAHIHINTFNINPELTNRLISFVNGIVNKGSLCHIWSNEHNGWWKSNRQGYTQLRSEAGIYDYFYAKSIAIDANYQFNRGFAEKPNELIVPII